MEMKACAQRGGVGHVQADLGEVSLLDSQHIRLDRRRHQGGLGGGPVRHIPAAELQQILLGGHAPKRRFTRHGAPPPPRRSAASSSQAVSPASPPHPAIGLGLPLPPPPPV
eukprot:EG_transcript_47954